MSLLYQAMQRAMCDYSDNRSGAGFLFGCVKTIAPLSIEIDGKLVLSEKFLTVAEHLTDYEIPYEMLNMDKATHKEKRQTEIVETNLTNGFYVEHEGRQELLVDPNAGEFKEFNGQGTIKLYNHLLEGDRVILARMEAGHQFIVLDRLPEEGKG